MHPSHTEQIDSWQWPGAERLRGLFLCSAGSLLAPPVDAAEWFLKRQSLSLVPAAGLCALPGLRLRCQSCQVRSRDSRRPVQARG